MEPLSQCEYQVAREVAKGHTPDEIADLLKKVGLDDKSANTGHS